MAARTPTSKRASRRDRLLPILSLIPLTVAALVAAAIVCAAPAAAKPGDILWGMRIGASGQDAFYDVARTPDGGVVAVGFTNLGPSGVDGDGLIVKYSATGVQQWANAYDYGDGADDEFSHVTVTPGGAIVAAGYHSSPATNKDILVVRYSASGAFGWSTLVHGGGSFSDDTNDVMVDRNGDVRVVGTSHEPGNEALCAARLDGPTGILTWQIVSYGPVGSTWATGASGAVARGGALYITGKVQNSAGAWRMLLMKVRAKGTVSWIRSWRPTGSKGAFGEVVRLDPKGRPWVLAEVAVGQHSDVLLVRYTTAGVRSLVRRYGFATARWDYPEDMVIDGSGRVFASGDSDNAAGTASAGFVLAYSNDGARSFARLYPRTGPRDTSFTAVLADGKGGAYVCGRVSEPQAYLHRLIAHYTATGTHAWSRSITNMAVQGDDQYEALARCGSAGIAVVGYYLYAADDFDAVVAKHQK